MSKSDYLATADALTAIIRDPESEEARVGALHLADFLHRIRLISRALGAKG